MINKVFISEIKHPTGGFGWEIKDVNGVSLFIFKKKNDETLEEAKAAIQLIISKYSLKF